MFQSFKFLNFPLFFLLGNVQFFNINFLVTNTKTLKLIAHFVGFVWAAPHIYVTTAGSVISGLSILQFKQKALKFQALKSTMPQMKDNESLCEASDFFFFFFFCSKQNDKKANCYWWKNIKIYG